MQARKALEAARLFIQGEVAPIIRQHPRFQVKPSEYGFRVKQPGQHPADPVDLLVDFGQEVARRGQTLYLHYPYCGYHCTFCHYAVTVAGEEKRLAAQPTGVLLQEMDLRLRAAPDLARGSVTSVYIGGGTPALMAEAELSHLMEGLGERFEINSNAEVTIEGTPQSFSPEKIRVLRHLGITRVSLGIQVLDDAYLHWLNRKHTAQEALAALSRLMDAGFAHVNVDLIYGFPRVSAQKFIDDLRVILGSRPTSITTYRLRLQRPDEGRTSLYTLYQAKPEQFPSLEEVYRMQVAARILIKSEGYDEGPAGWYTLPGAFPQVYLDRWVDQRVLSGFGQRAYSYSPSGEMHNCSSLSAFTAAVAGGQLPVQVAYRYTLEERERRWVSFRLKSVDLVNEAEFEREFGGLPLDRPVGEYLRTLLEIGLLESSVKGLALSEAGKVLVEELI